MAVLVDKRLEVDEGLSSVINGSIALHETHPILAVAGYDQNKGGLIQVYYDDSSRIAADILPKSGIQVTILAWHPVRKLLAISWENGEICLWNETDHTTYETQAKHKNQVSLLLWNENGSHLISADTSGGCVGWKLDSQGTLSVLFHHQLKTAVTAVVLRNSRHSDRGDELIRLARAAVDGDEGALNAFTSWAPQNGAKSFVAKKDCLDFFVGSAAGTVIYITDSGSFTEVLQLEGNILHLLYYAAKDFLIVVTEMLFLIQYKIVDEGTLIEHSKMKLSGQTINISVIWCGPETLGVSAGERTLRLWNIENGQNWVLSLEGDSFKNSETITCISYDKNKGTLGAGTSHGHVTTWKFISAKRNVQSYSQSSVQEDEWKIQAPLQVHGAVLSLGWGTSKNLLGVITATDGYIVNEYKMCYSYLNQIAAIQISSRHVSVHLLTEKVVIEIKTEFHIKNVYVAKGQVLLSDGKRLLFYDIDASNKSARLVSSFNTESLFAIAVEEIVFVLEESSLRVRSQQGIVKQTLSSSEEEGWPYYINLCNTYMTVVFSLGFVKIWDVGKQGIKVHGGPKTISTLQKDNCFIESAKCNSSGNKVSIITTENLKKDLSVNLPILYIWDLENGSISSFDFMSGKFSTDEKSGGVPTVIETPEMICGRYPLSHFWDEEDPRLLVCTLKMLPSAASERTSVERKGRMKRSSSSQTFELEKIHTIVVVTFFVTSEYALKIQDVFPLQENQSDVLGVSMPHYYILNKHAHEENSSKIPNEFASKESGFISRLTMRDFFGLEECDKTTRDAIMDFSFYLTTGNMDEAFRSIKMIKNETVWENMARMCVKTKRLDVAVVCLGKMGHARGAKALREAESIPELDARVAILAIQLGMITEAERLFKVCGRYDFLNKLYQDSGQWSKALEVAEHMDRIHRRNSYYNYAKYLESNGDIAAAISMFEKSDTHHFEVPHMLFDEPRALEAYILKNSDREMLRWWAQYMESIGEMESALQFYERANDNLSLVRVYCYCNNLEKAAEIANETGDRAACFHLGRQFENRDNVDEAVHFFTRARAFNNAIRICKEQGMEDQLLNLALMGGPEKMVDVAHYYEDHPEHIGKAAMLYHKAGYITKAIEMAFKNKELDAVQHIAMDLNKNADPEILRKCAEFFIESSQYDRAVDLLATAGKHMVALELAAEKGVPLSEELAEKLTISKADADQATRAEVLNKIGQICMLQENYHLAAKKFTQAGNKVQAMKALLKSGDTEKIIFFAGVSRQKEIYVMAGNYLQSLDWRQDPEIMKNIIGFYTKGKALESLAGFYDACAQVEIDEYQNYEKALGALGEAFKCLSKSPGVQDGQKLQQLQVKMEFLKRFVQARRLFESNLEEGIAQCQSLLQDRDIELAVRRGDIYGFIVEQYARKENYKNAYAVIEEMKERIPGVNLAYYVAPDILRTIYTTLNIKPVGQNNFSLLDKGQDDTNANTSDNEVEEDYMVAENGF